MRASLAILLLVVLGAPLGLAAPPGKGPILGGGARHPRADKYLAAGEYRRAARAFRTVLDRAPADRGARLGLALSLAPLWDCEEPLTLLASLRGGPEWGPRALTAETRCLDIRGDRAQARAAAWELWMLHPSESSAGQRAWLALVDGDGAGYEGALADLSDESRTGLPMTVMRAWEALERGLPDFDLRLAEARSEAERLGAEGVEAQLALLDGRRWLDLDDPEEALPILRPAMMQFKEDPRLGAWQLEATRRAGDASMAAMGEKRPALKKAHGALMDGVRARIYVDVGELERAKTVLAPLVGSDDPEVLASQWYVARAEGDTEAMALYERLWAGRNACPDRKLEQLVPIDQR